LKISAFWPGLLCITSGQDTSWQTRKIRPEKREVTGSTPVPTTEVAVTRAALPYERSALANDLACGKREVAGDGTASFLTKLASRPPVPPRLGI
jgi:hypothetical protein